MPVYEYWCESCSSRFELRQSIKDEPVAICAQCGKSVGRIISAPAIMFKGSGWYVTDYSDKMKPPTGESAETTAPAKKETPAESGASSPAPAAASAPTAPASTGNASPTGNSSTST